MGWCAGCSRHPHVVARLADPDGLPPCHHAHAHHSTPPIQLCVDDNNWFDTGDVASIDKFGVMRIQDRLGLGMRSHEAVEHAEQLASLFSVP
jgi:hypothetical protein